MSRSTVLPEDSAPPWRGFSLRRAISCGRDQPLWRALIGPSRKSMRFIGTAGPLAEKKNCLIVDAQENLGALTADSLRLKQIPLILLSNACKFTKAGEVALRVPFSFGSAERMAEQLRR
jgi:signal transduction histidine kinase